MLLRKTGEERVVYPIAYRVGMEPYGWGNGVGYRPTFRYVPQEMLKPQGEMMDEMPIEQERCPRHTTK